MWATFNIIEREKKGKENKTARDTQNRRPPCSRRDSSSVIVKLHFHMSRVKDASDTICAVAEHRKLFLTLSIRTQAGDRLFHIPGHVTALVFRALHSDRFFTYD